MGEIPNLNSKHVNSTHKLCCFYYEKGLLAGLFSQDDFSEVDEKVS